MKIWKMIIMNVNYESMGPCWSQVKFVFKHVLIFIYDMDLQNENMEQMTNGHHYHK